MNKQTGRNCVLFKRTFDLGSGKVFGISDFFANKLLLWILIIMISTDN